jgi:hypothetical protein
MTKRKLKYAYLLCVFLVFWVILLLSYFELHFFFGKLNGKDLLIFEPFPDKPPS